MNITVNVEDVSLDSIVGEHYSQIGPDEWGREPQTLGQAIADRLAKTLESDDGYRTLKQRFTDMTNAEIKAQVTPIVAAAIAASVQPTNAFGEPTGEPVSLTSLIVKEVKDVLGKRSDYGRGKTLIQEVIAAEVDKAIRKELSDVIAAEKAKVVAAVQAKAAELIATAVREGVGR